MIIVRTPLRVSFFGGGTDLPSFYSRYGGACLSFSIDKYIYQMAHPHVESEEILLKYSQNEKTSSSFEIQHPVYRQVLSSYKLKGVDYSVSSDIPAGTGLGSSSAFTVGLLHLTREYLNLDVNQESLAKEACEIEIVKLRENIGKQDQFACAVGGLNLLTFTREGLTKINPVFVSEDFKQLIEKNSILIRVGSPRSSSKQLEEQSSKELSKKQINALLEMKNMAEVNFSNISGMSLDTLAEILKETWTLKKLSNSKVSNPLVEEVYNKVISMGALACKLLGAGGSGYLFVLAKIDVIEQISEKFGKRAVPIRMEFSGTVKLYDSRSNHVVR